MSKIFHASKIVESNPELSKKDLVALIEKELGVTKANARVYLYNVGKRKDKPAKNIHAVSNKLISDAIKRDPSLGKVKRSKDSKVLEPVASAA